jgi:hypothetical protein
MQRRELTPLGAVGPRLPHTCRSAHKLERNTSEGLWGGLREMLWLASVIGVLSAAGVGLAVVLAAG